MIGEYKYSTDKINKVNFTNSLFKPEIENYQNFIFRCKGMMFLETYTTLSRDELKERLPEFLTLGPEVTGEPAFSMYNLTLKGGWINNDNFCHRLSDEKNKDPNGRNKTENSLFEKF